MNNVASFLSNLMTRSPTMSKSTQSDSGTLKNGRGDGDGFDAVLSGFSANSSHDEPSTDVGMPARSSSPAMEARNTDTSLPISKAFSTGRAATLSQPSLHSGAPAAGRVSKGLLASAIFPEASDETGVAAQGRRQGRGLPSSALSTVTGGAKFAAATPSLADAAGATLIAKNSTAAGSRTAQQALVKAPSDVAKSPKLANPKSNDVASTGVIAGGSIAGIAAALPTALPIQSAPRSSAGDRSASGLSKVTDKKSSESVSVDSGTVDATAQAAMVAGIVVVSPLKAVSSGSNGSQNQRPAVTPQINVRAQMAVDDGATVDAAQNDSSAVSLNGFADVAKMTVTSVSTATHFAPVAKLSPVQQIADAVLGAMPGLSQPSGGAAAAASADAVETDGSTSFDVSLEPAVASGSEPVKVLNLELEPASLGSVTITLNLSANGLDVHLAASQPSTMNLIDKDKDSLSDQLRQSGYSLAGVAVTLNSHAGSNVANNGSATQNPNGQAASQSGSQPMSYGGSPNGNGTSQHNARSSSGRAASTQGQIGAVANSEAAAPSRRAAAGDLYL